MDKIQEYYDNAKEETTFSFPYKNEVIKYSLNLKEYVLKDNYQLNYSSFNIIDFTDIDTINLNITTVDEVTTPLKYYSRSVFNNTLSYALQKKLLDNKLDSSWSSKYFDFFIGDIALAIPSVRYKYYSNEKVIGKCNATNQEHLKFDDQTGGGEISLEISYKCTISAEKDDKLIITFDIVPIITVNPVLNKDSLEFIVSKAGLKKDPVFTPVADFPLTNQNLAKDFINDGIQNLIGQTVFNGFPVDYRRVPGSHMESDYLILFQARC